MFASFLGFCFGRNTRVAERAKPVVVKKSAAVIEILEERKLLSTVTFTADSVALTPAAAAIYLTPGNNLGDVRVRYGSPTAAAVYTFTGASDTDQITSPSAGVVFYQTVPAAAEPDGGIVVAAGSGGTLTVVAGPTDTLIEVVASTSTSATVQVTDASGGGSPIIATDGFGAGVSNLTLVANDAGGATANVPNLSGATHLDVRTGLGTGDAVTLGGDETVVGADVETGAGNDTVTVTSDGDDATTATVDAGDGTGTGNVPEGIEAGRTFIIHSLSIYGGNCLDATVHSL